MCDFAVCDIADCDLEVCELAVYVLPMCKPLLVRYFILGGSRFCIFLFFQTDVVSKREVSLSDATGSVLVRSVHAVKNHRFVDIHGGRHSLRKVGLL